MPKRSGRKAAPRLPKYSGKAVPKSIVAARAIAHGIYSSFKSSSPNIANSSPPTSNMPPGKRLRYSWSLDVDMGAPVNIDIDGIKSEVPQYGRAHTVHIRWEGSSNGTTMDSASDDLAMTFTSEYGFDSEQHILPLQNPERMLKQAVGGIAKKVGRGFERHLIIIHYIGGATEGDSGRLMLKPDGGEYPHPISFDKVIALLQTIRADIILLFDMPVPVGTFVPFFPSNHDKGRVELLYGRLTKPHPNQSQYTEFTRSLETIFDNLASHSSTFSLSEVLQALLAKVHEEKKKDGNYPGTIVAPTFIKLASKAGEPCIALMPLKEQVTEAQDKFVMVGKDDVPDSVLGTRKTPHILDYSDSDDSYTEEERATNLAGWKREMKMNKWASEHGIFSDDSDDEGEMVSDEQVADDVEMAACSDDEVEVSVPTLRLQRFGIKVSDEALEMKDEEVLGFLVLGRTKRGDFMDEDD